MPPARKPIATVSKLPADFVPRTLARLLPGAAEVAVMSKAEMLTYIEQREKMTRLIEREPIRFFRPHAGSGQEAFAHAGDPGSGSEGKRVFGYFAGNKSGKTSVTAVKTIERLNGRSLWGDRDVVYKSPCRWAYFAEDFDSHKEVTIPTLLSWAPQGFFKNFVRNSQGAVVQVDCANGSLMHFRTYDQGSDKAEGKDWDGLSVDEPPNRSVYTAMYRGLVAQAGVMFIAATLLKEPWLYDEIEQEYFFYAGGDIDDNVWLDPAAKRDFLASLTEDEREVRKTGKPTHLTGLIYKELVDAPPFVVPLHPVPSDAPIIMGVDPHERKPCHILWGYLTPSSRIVWFDWALCAGSTKQIHQQVLDKERYHPGRAVMCIMDPNRGKQRQIQYSTDQPDCWAQVFEEWGYDVVFPNDELAYGHKQLRDMLSYTRDEAGAVALPPGMVWTENCRGKNGPIYQMLRYAWDDWNAKKMERDPKERPRDRYKDFPDICRYAAAVRPDYGVLRNGPQILNLLGDRQSLNLASNRPRAYG